MHLTCFVCKRFACVRVCMTTTVACIVILYKWYIIPMLKYNKSCDCKRKLKCECECELRFQDKRTQCLIRKNNNVRSAKSMFLWLVNCKRCLFSTSTATKIVQYFVYCNSNGSSSSGGNNNKRENAHTFSRVLLFSSRNEKEIEEKSGTFREFIHFRQRTYCVQRTLCTICTTRTESVSWFSITCFTRISTLWNSCDAIHTNRMSHLAKRRRKEKNNPNTQLLLDTEWEWPKFRLSWTVCHWQPKLIGIAHTIFFPVHTDLWELASKPTNAKPAAL